MRILITFVLLAMVPAVARSQGRVVNHTEVRRYAGEEATVEGLVVKVEPGGSGSLWLSLGDPHPRSTIVIILPEEFARTIETPDSLQGAVIRGYGRIMGAGASSSGSQARGNTPGLRGRAPRTPYLVVLDRRFQVVSRPDTTSTRPDRR
jgi:hypothetical protein